jgi:site-specific DNA recombinase
MKDDSMATRALIYLRVSTDEQADTGVSLAVQRNKCTGYAGLYDLTVIEVIEDRSGSGKTLGRDGLQRALVLLKTGAADALLVYKLDRLTRSVRDLGVLLEYFPAETGKPALLSVCEQVDTRTASGRMVLNILISVAQWERETIVERTTTALRHKKESGAVYGSTPFGFDRDGDRLVPNNAEQAIIRDMRQSRADGLSFGKIADQLNTIGVKPKRGVRWYWYPSSVKWIIENGLRS